MNGYEVLTNRGGDLFCIRADSVTEAVETLEFLGYEVLGFSEWMQTITVSH